MRSPKWLIPFCAALSLVLTPAVAFAGGGGHHPGGPSRPDRPNRPDRPDRPEWPGWPDRPDRPEWPGFEWPDFPDAPDWPGLPDRPDFPDRPPPPTGNADEIQAYVTGYSFWDNTPPGSSEISNPVIHDEAGGTGTFRNPVTVAVGHTLSGGRDILDYEEGTRFYIPSLRKYFIVEDTCGDGPRPQDGPCHDLSQAPRDAEAWLDVWAGGEDSSNSQADRCMAELTGVHTVLVDPPAGYRVSRGDIVGEDGDCNVGFSDTPSRARRR